MNVASANLRTALEHARAGLPVFPARITAVSRPGRKRRASRTGRARQALTKCKSAFGGASFPMLSPGSSLGVPRWW